LTWTDHRPLIPTSWTFTLTPRCMRSWSSCVCWSHVS